MSVTAVLFKSKKLFNGEHPIMIRYTVERKSKYVITPFSSSENLWDQKKKRPKKRHPQYLLIDEYLNVEIARVQKAIIKSRDEEKPFTFEDFEKLLKGRQHNADVYAFIEEIIQRKKSLGKIKTASSYKDALKAVKRCAKSQKHLRFSEVDYRFLITMEEKLRQEGVGTNTLGIYMRTLRAAYNSAIKEGLVDKGLYPFNDYKVSKLKAPTQKRALTKAQIKQIEQLPVEKESLKWHMRNYFLFSYYCRGINFKDLAFLKWENIRDGRLVYVRRKTRDLLNMKIPIQAQQILIYYQQHPESDYVFPILSDFHQTPTQIEDRINKILGYLNDAMSELGKEIGLNFRITSYFARHTYATVAKRSKVPISMISEAMGHSHESVTKAYLDSFENDELDDAHEGIL